MADPIRIAYQWGSRQGRPGGADVEIGLIVRHDGLRRAAYMIAKHELSIWFEPCWADARILAQRFPHCIICSIPTESNTESLRKTPGWRLTRRNCGAV